MASFTVKNLPNHVHQALCLPAAQHGPSPDVEIQAILEAAVMPGQRPRLGDELAKLGLDLGFTNENMEDLESGHDRRPAEPANFE